jgi:cytoplasmic FMR1 interacting protein
MFILTLILTCSGTIFLKQLPVVPLFGDIQIGLASYIKMCPHFDSMRDKWTCANENADEKLVGQYKLTNKMDTIREEHVRFISELARYNNEVHLY